MIMLLVELLSRLCSVQSQHVRSRLSRKFSLCSSYTYLDASVASDMIEPRWLYQDVENVHFEYTSYCLL